LRDIVILMRGARNKADVFQRMFAENDLPAFTDTVMVYFDTFEIETFMNLLSVIDNRRRDIPLLSVMYSPIFKFSTEELMDIRLAAPRDAYCDALFFCAEPAADGGSGAESATVSAPLRGKIGAMLSRLSAWREQSAFMPLDAFLWSLLKDSGYYTFAGALPGGVQRRANLRALVDRALDFQNTHMRGLGGFIGYMEHIRRRTDVGQARMIGESDDVLRIMTVHKSKGLEFPVVIVAGLGGRFVAERGGAVSLHKDVGLALRLTDPETGLYKSTLLQNLIVRKKSAENFAEEIRILYVAFTRAMDRLILLGSAKGGLAGVKKYGDSSEGSSHLELIAPIAERAGLGIVEIPAPASGRTSRGALSGGDPLSLLSSAEDCDPETATEIDRRLSFIYPHERAASVKSKYAATELAALSAAGAEGDRAASREAAPFAAAVPRFMSGKRELLAAERGSLTHRALERMDFRAARGALEREEGLENMLADLVSSGVFTPEEAMAADMERIRNFIASDICRRAAASPELHKETPFVIKKEHVGEEVLVQGVIDCWFVENGEIVLLDYKSGFAVPHAPGKSREEALRRLSARYKPQLDIYAEALETIRGARVSEAYLFLLGEGLCLRVGTN
jgi:ATP-dependent helicase/nuclease subunit A